MGSLTVDSLETILGRPVAEVVLTVAKSSVFGMDSSAIAEALGVEKGEIDSLMQSEDYKDVRLLVGAESQKEKVDRDSGWDGIESSALSKLSRRVSIESDTEMLLKIASVANRATRRSAPQREVTPLDASSAGQRIPLQLTKRYIEKIQDGQVTQREEIQQISILNGSAVNPSFEEVQGELAKKADKTGLQSPFPSNANITSHNESLGLQSPLTGQRINSEQPANPNAGSNSQVSAAAIASRAMSLADTLAKGFIDGD